MATRDPDANARLTSAAGLTLFVLLAVQGVTILRIHRLLTLHFVIGFALLAPLAVKLATTGYRFLRYYTGDPAYGAAGPPRPVLRVAAPVLVISTLAVFGTGVALAFTRRGHEGPLLFLHKASFVVWFAVTTLHVLAHLGRAVSRVRHRFPAVLVIASLVVGAAAGAAGLSLAHRWSGHEGRFKGPPDAARTLSHV